MTVSKVFVDGRNARPFTFTVRHGEFVTHHRFHDEADAKTAREEFAANDNPTKKESAK